MDLSSHFRKGLEMQKNSKCQGKAVVTSTSAAASCFGSFPSCRFRSVPC
jgi:hypothetical protein